MLTEFRVKNFKGFRDELMLDFSQDNYAFSPSAVKDGIVNKALIYGHNGCGKSNLGLAIFDLVLHLTDKEKMLDKYDFYLNGNSDEDSASFFYRFVFAEKIVEYSYAKVNAQELKTEKLVIDGKMVLDYNFHNDEGFCALEGAENLRINSPDSRLSKVKFIKNNAILSNNEINNAFYAFTDYVDRMLLFYSLETNRYQGFRLGSEQLDDSIIKAGKLREFKKFLQRAEISDSIDSQEINGNNIIVFKYKNGSIPFSKVASMGTKSLELLFYWLISISQASFVFIDEFDAFYHHELAELIVKELLDIDSIQCILTTHNTDLLSNDLLRPDCYYQMDKHGIRSLSESTRKEIRQAHNIQKMFKAGAFNGE